MSKDDCEAAGFSLNPNPGRSLQVGSGGKCLDGSWGQVPLGCSVQSGGDGAACYKTSGDTGEGCISKIYQLVCLGKGEFFKVEYCLDNFVNIKLKSNMYQLFLFQL